MNPWISMTLRCLWPAWVMLSGASCFESGPLQLGTNQPVDLADGSAADSSGDLDGAEVSEDASNDSTNDSTTDDSANPPGDATSDSAEAGETNNDSETSIALDSEDAELSDAETSEDIAEVDVAPEIVGPACLVDNDCAGVVQDDRCAGPIRCIDYSCRESVGERVVCAAGGPCLDVRCNPTSGRCDETNTCSCETPDVLQCGVPTSWTTGEAAARDNIDAFACGPAPAGERVRLFALPAAGRLRVTSSGEARGLHVIQGGVCDGASGCVLGGRDVVYVDSAAVAPYTLLVDEGAPNQRASVRTDCNITSEGVCDDGLDDDGDGLTDCQARECNGIAGCVLPPEHETGLCGNALDDDRDGLTDCADEDCVDDRGCLESCYVEGGSTYCNYQQGLPNGGGKSRSTHYSCNPVPQTAREIIFRIDAGFTGRIRIGFESAGGLALYLLKETGRGCTPRDCVKMATGDMSIDLVIGDTYYLSVDGPGNVEADFYIHIDCLGN